MLGYVKNIKEGKAKRPNGRPFVNVSNTAFYCYVIADLTDSMREDNAKNADGKKADVYSLAKTLWIVLTGVDHPLFFNFAISG